MSDYSINVTTGLAALGLTNLANDGVTNNTDAFNALFEYLGYYSTPAQTHPMVLDFPAGKYGVATGISLFRAGSGGSTLRGLGGPLHSDTEPTAAYLSAARIVPLAGWSGATLLTLGGCTGVHFDGLVFDDLGGAGSAGGVPLTNFVLMQDTPAYCAALTFERCGFIGDTSAWGNASWHKGQRGITVTGTTGGSNN